MRRLLILSLVFYNSYYCVDDTGNCFVKYDRQKPPTTVVLLGIDPNKRDGYYKNTHLTFSDVFFFFSLYKELNKMDYELVDVYLSNNRMKTIFNEYVSNESLVIHLNVTDFYQHNYNDVLKHNYTFAGHIGPEIKNDVCRSTITAETNDIEKCEKSVEIQRNVKLVSKSVLEHKLLLKLIEEFDVQFDKDTMIRNIRSYYNAKDCVNIVVCESIARYDLPKEIISKYENIKFRTQEECQDAITEETLAVLTSVPFKLSKFEQLYTPTIFYNHVTMFDSPETADVFVNGFSIVNQTDIMELSFLHFFIKMNWRRVGIISDKSLYSSEFEETLTSLLRKENFVVGSKSCVDPNCNFTEVFDKFAEAEAKVVIANVPETSALEFAQKVSRSSLGQRKIVWLVRCWSSAVAKEAAQAMGDIFSITLGPKMYDLGYDYCRDEDCVSTYVIHPLKTILEILETHRISTSDIKSTANQRKYAQMMKNKLFETIPIYAYVKRYKKNDDTIYFKFPGVFASMTFDDYTLKEYNAYGKPGIEPERIKNCFIKSNVYFKPCSDKDVIFIMIICFVTTFLAIMYIFLYKLLQSRCKNSS